MRISDWSSDVCSSDLLSAAPYLQEKLGGEMAIGREIVTVQGVFGKVFNEGTEFERDGSQFDRLLDDGDELMIGEVPLIALHVPGHTPADMAYIVRSEEHTSELQSLMRISYVVFCLKTKQRQ